MNEPYDATLARFEDQLAAADQPCFELTLFVSGASGLAARAIANCRQICDTYLSGRSQVVVVDVHDDPAAVVASGILATPTLVKTWPLPVRKIVGDLSRTDDVLRALGLPVPQVSREG